MLLTRFAGETCEVLPTKRRKFKITVLLSARPRCQISAKEGYRRVPTTVMLWSLVRTRRQRWKQVDEVTELIPEDNGILSQKLPERG